MTEWLSNFSETVNDSFYFVVDKLVTLQVFFNERAWEIGKVVLLIAVLTAALNYALTGQNLKENVIKILKATIFFVIVSTAYPKIIGFISAWSYDMAYKSIYPSVAAQFNRTRTYVSDNNFSVDIGDAGQGGGFGNRLTFSRQLTTVVTEDLSSKLFPNLLKERKVTIDSSGKEISYSSIAPAAVINLIFVLSGECFNYAETQDNHWHFPDLGRFAKGLICAFFIIFTGVFALLEYLMCVMEFFLVASVGIILLPFSIWEGSKFITESYIKAMLGFFLKMLFCSLAICLMIYGFTTLFIVTSAKNGFLGTVDQIVYIIFACLLFFYICKSAPGMAQSLLTGAPSLSATGAISAVGGALAATGATFGMAKAAGGTAKSMVGGMAKAGMSATGALSEAGAAAGAAKTLGGTGSQQAGAFASSLAGSAKDTVSAAGLGLARSIMGGGSGGAGSGGGSGGANPYSWKDDFLKPNEKGEQKTYSQHLQDRKVEGTERGLDYMAKQESKANANKPVKD